MFAGLVSAVLLSPLSLAGGERKGEEGSEQKGKDGTLFHLDTLLFCCIL